MPQRNPPNSTVSGSFLNLAGERYYVIENVDKMAPFFVNVVSDSDHWLFVASNGGLSAGSVSPDTALFPYITVDKIYDSTLHTGAKTLLRIETDGKHHYWEPFNREQDACYTLTRRLYKNTLGNKILFEEENHDLHLVFRYTWSTSDTYGFIRDCELENTGPASYTVSMVDGLMNILPAGTPRFTQTNSSYLVDAYKWSELDANTGLGFFSLFSGITDRAEPCESLRATTVFSLGFEDYAILLSTEQLNSFRDGRPVEQELHKRGIRGAYLVSAAFDLPAGKSRQWSMVANLEQTQAESVALQHQLTRPQSVAEAVTRSVEQGSDTLSRIQAAGDGFQLTAEEQVSNHHYANVLFNTLRGGIFDQQYTVSLKHFGDHVRLFNKPVYERSRELLESLPGQMNATELRARVTQQDDTQLLRLCYEYLPITFGRRHGDPSRPWNHFAIELSDQDGERLLSYQGNWRDIFQNWEALLLSYPEFTENIIAKFINASTIDGYNPYRISNEGIDWEVEDPDDPWSYIGYWGDHQIIYLQKLLELSQQFHPNRLAELLHQPLFSYANVPYKIKPLQDVVNNPKATVYYDDEQALRIEQRTLSLGADGKLVLDAGGQVYQVTLLEKLLVALLSKLGNLVIDGGIWLNTQRPEWNDANNALVGQGLSMVTLYYLRRYVSFLDQLLADQSDSVSLSMEVSAWLTETADSLMKARGQLQNTDISPDERHALLLELGHAASSYRETVYAQEGFAGGVSMELSAIRGMLDDARLAIDHSIRSNERPDGLYHAYNLLQLENDELQIHRLYPMLEGQVAALSSGVIGPEKVIVLLESLFESELFRPDQNSFLLYPDRQLPGFLQKNCVPAEAAESIPLLARMLAGGDKRLIERDAGGTYRFNAELTNIDAVNACLDQLGLEYGKELEAARAPLQALYEQVFNHRSFTGRSGGMFGFEGLGSIYWHMVSKLLLAVEENFYSALDQGAGADLCQQLGHFYYRIRDGLGYNKTPAEYGAFPTDPYSHTPQHAGAQQPGMTGMVKEEILARFGELGIRIRDGAVRFEPRLLRAQEFISAARPFRFLDVSGQWQELTVPTSGLAVTWCQVPLVYRLDDSEQAHLSVLWHDGATQTFQDLTLDADIAAELFRRTGRIRQIDLVINRKMLLREQ